MAGRVGARTCGRKTLGVRVGRRAAWLMPVALAVASLVGAACTAGPSARPAIVVNDGGGSGPTGSAPPGGPAPVPPLGEPRDASVRWTTCGPELVDRLARSSPPPWLRLECGRVNGLLDSPYAPGRGTLRMQVLRAGTGPVPILVLDDVDGLPGTLRAARLAAAMPQEFLSRFSLVGLDRRGTGNTDPVHCVPSDVRADLVDADPRALGVEDWVDLARTAGQQCSIALETRLPALDTWRTAADVEVVRAALGVERLHAIGRGEGARVLAVHAERHPDRVGRVVLDGLPDPNEDAAAVLEGAAAGAEAALDAFAADCAARGCPLGASARQALAEVLDRSASEPMAGPGGLDLTPGVVLRAVHAGLADRAGWPAMAEALAAARSGAPEGLAALAAPLVQESEERPPTFDAALVVRCNDTKTRLSTEQIADTARDWNTRYPVFGALMAQWLALCGPWPVSGQPVTPVTAGAAPPIVVLSTATDPVTPQEGTAHAVRTMATAVGVEWQGAGHGALGVSSCATAAAQAFLSEGTVPRDGTVCPP